MKKSLSSVLFAFSMLVFPSLSGASGPGDEHWDNQFGAVGANSALYSLAVNGSNIYVGGTFTMAGNTKANAVAGFDGTNWFPLNSGLLNLAIVVGLSADGNYLYAGGLFTNADDPNAINTARWDGSNWSAIGTQGIVENVKRNGSNVYFAGLFPGIGGVISTNIIGWDGTNWFALGQGLAGNGYNFVSSVNCFTLQGSNIYAGGNFSYSGASIMTNVAYWDGNAWHGMGNPFNGPVNALLFYGGDLYAGGAFTNTTLHVTNLARWDGGSWSAVPGGGADKVVSDLATDGTNLFVGGSFTQIGGIAATGIVSFSGSTWSPLGAGVFGVEGFGGTVNKMAWQSNQLYVVGAFERAGNVGAANVARWDGANWWGLGRETSKGLSAPIINRIFNLYSYNGSGPIPRGLYAGGYFYEAGNAVARGIARWDGTNWNSVGDGVNGVLGTAFGVRAMAADATGLYMGGLFTNAGGVTASCIARWDGTNWSSLGSGADYIVDALAIDNYGYLYVGGAFTNMNGMISKGLSVLAFGNWYNIGAVEGNDGNVYSLAFDGSSKMYVGGSFLTGNSVSANNIAYINTSDLSWHALGAGLDAKVNTVAYGNGYLYAGGSFTNAGAVTVNRIARWDGANWSAMGSGIVGRSLTVVNGITVAGTNVYVTGNFTNAGGVTVSNIACWDGASWHAMGSGLEFPRAGFTLAVGSNTNDVFVGGTFTTAGDKPSFFIARWNDQTNFYPPANLMLTRAAHLTNGLFRFRVNGTYGQSYIIQGSTDLAAWTPIETNSIMFYDFTDPNSSAYPYRFYRAVLGP